MSVENVRAFFSQVEVDKSLQAHIYGLHRKAQNDLAEAVKDLVNVASAAGFGFTADDYAVVRAAHVDPPSQSDDSDENLECCNSSWSCCKVKTM